MSGERILFIDRDGTIIEEPPDEQVDSLQKLRLLPGVIPALLELQRAGYRLVLVSNQDGLGTASFPEPAFREPQDFLRALLASQGITFDAEFFCPHVPADGCECRKPTHRAAHGVPAATRAGPEPQLRDRRPRHRPAACRQPRSRGFARAG